ncbi:MULTISPECIES: DNA polymerase III subunit delta [unclassified Okeania]|uniref:DNA polymerase III subunit delta n=1 Tax=unclassified Okeania TaxID=2634635 RepID=UPI0013B6DCC5|nr:MULTISPECIES: DNA polymerase III subunit delta [unclassified Okeania]NES75960.1 DNA polymerase III subunit delta [Okeania sp. SIO1H4]NET18921.1 DNA polymerase III subunit delta [Okeania sp. SIO1H5]NET93370.1 DNA polymerase III subunit delta [Okeania sp. SIO1H2]
MPIYLYFGEDEYSMMLAVNVLRESVLDPNWASFNYDKILPAIDAVQTGLNQAMTPPFGSGSRFVWLVDTNITQHCSQNLLENLESTLPQIPETTVLLLTTSNKPDKRLKSTKLIQKWAEVKDFSPIPPWKTELLEQQVKEMAQEVGVKLNSSGVTFLAEALGNDRRQLHSELTKLQLYVSGDSVVDLEVITALVGSQTQSSLKLATAIRLGDTVKALELVADLIAHNEHPLRIVATLVGQFRVWFWVKLMIETGERDEKAIAQAAEIGNPKRIYFLRQEVNSLSLNQLQKTLPLLLELEVSLKQGKEQISTLQTKVIELCQVFSQKNIFSKKS